MIADAIRSHPKILAAQAQADAARADGRPTLSLFDDFSRKYKARGAQAQADSKDAELAGIEQQVTLEVWKSNQALRTEAENLHNTDILLRKARQSFEVAHGRYKAGVRNILKLLKAQSDLVNAQQKRTLSLTSWQTVRLRLATSLGRLRIDGL